MARWIAAALSLLLPAQSWAGPVAVASARAGETGVAAGASLAVPRIVPLRELAASTFGARLDVAGAPAGPARADDPSLDAAAAAFLEAGEPARPGQALGASFDPGVVAVAAGSARQLNEGRAGVFDGAVDRPSPVFVLAPLAGLPLAQHATTALRTWAPHVSGALRSWAPHAVEAVRAWAPHAAAILGSASYVVANCFALAFPIPEIRKAFIRGHTRRFPLLRASLGALGAVALGVVNATVLGKTAWGIGHIIIGLGMVAPYFVGRWLERRGSTGYALAPGPAPKGFLRGLAWRLRGDGALKRALVVGGVLAIVSVGLYAGAAAFVPVRLKAWLSQEAIERLLIGIQLFKAALFAAVFVPDAWDFARGRKTHGFSLGFDLMFLASAVAFVIWGVQAAFSVPAGGLRTQYLLHAGRNLGEAAAAGLSVFALRRAAKRAAAAPPEKKE